MRLAVSATVALAIAFVAAQDSPQKWTSLAFTHVAVIDGTGTSVKPDHTVVVREKRIDAVGPFATTKVPGDAPGTSLHDELALLVSGSDR